MPSSGAVLDLTPMLQPERAALLELLRGLSDADWQLPTECPAWNAKGIALHILGDDFSLLTRQRDASTDSLTLFAEDHPGLSFGALLDGFNENWVNASRFLSNDLLIELLGLVGDRSEAFYCEVGLDTMSREPVGVFAQTEPSPYWQVISREYVERVTHQSQIRRAVGAVDLGADLVTPAAEVVAHLLAAWMREHTPPVGSAVAIDFGPVGVWTWVHAADRWEVRDGAADDAGARISVPGDQAVAMITRGLSSAEVVRSISITGDEALARPVVDIIGPLAGQPATPG